MSDEPGEGSLLAPLFQTWRAKQPKYLPGDPYVESLMDCQFVVALAEHANCTLRDAGLAFAGLSPTLRSLTAHRPGWCLLARTLCQTDAPDLVATLH
jgi:hypothetical protein